MGESFGDLGRYAAGGGAGLSARGYTRPLLCPTEPPVCLPPIQVGIGGVSEGAALNCIFIPSMHP